MDHKKELVSLMFGHQNKHTLPQFVESDRHDWVDYGKDNTYPEYLYKLSQRSAKHNAILTGKQHYIVGQGWIIDEDGISTEEVAALQGFIDNANDKESLNDILKKVSFDGEMYGGYDIELIWDNIGSKTSIHHIDFKNLRSSRDNGLFYFTKGWIKGDPDELRRAANPEENEDWEQILAFGPNQPRKGKYIVYVKEYRPGLEVYPLPEYIGAIPYIEIDYEIANFHLNNIKNGFSSGYWVKMRNGIPATEEEGKQIKKRIIEEMAGTNNAGDVVVSFEIPGKETELEPLKKNDYDKLFDTLNKTTRQEVFTGHKIVSPNLFGVETEEGFGNRVEIREKNELFQNNYVTPKQQELERVFNKLAQLNGLRPNLKIQPIEALTDEISESIMLQIMTPDELRGKAGLAAIEKTIEVGSEDVLNSLNTLSPLVANQVIANMTPDEVRALVGLGGIPAGQEPAGGSPSDEFHKDYIETEERILKSLSECGEPRVSFNVLEARPYTFGDEDEFKFNKSIDRDVLDLLSKDPFMSVEDIARQTKRTKAQIVSAMQRLVAANRISTRDRVSGDTKISERKVTKKGLDVIRETPAKTADIEVRYSYEVEAGRGAEVIPGTRDFCRNLLSLDRLYTRGEIELISSREGRNVWETRGGWYTQKGGTARPQCRHIWFQNIVTRK